MSAFLALLSRVSLLVILTPSVVAVPAASFSSTNSGLGINSTFDALGSTAKSPIRHYHVPNTPTTISFFEYSNPVGLKASSVYHTLVTGLNSVYHSAARPSRTGDSPIPADHIAWTFGGANIFIENHGTQGSNKLTWTILADTLLGIGAMLNELDCLQGQLGIFDEVLGNIGSGFVGKDYFTGVGNTTTAATTPDIGSA